MSLLWGILLASCAAMGHGKEAITAGRTKMVNALWVENPEALKFSATRSEVVMADLKGPGVIRMIHFALPANRTLDRALLLRIYWEGEAHPSVECPLVDFFFDPNGEIPSMNSLLVNKHRGWNAYFSMPFRTSARIVLTWDGPDKKIPQNLWDRAPCYAYVMYDEVPALPERVETFHATWRQQTMLLGKAPYEVFRAAGRGRFIGWHFTLRGVLPNPDDQEPPVDMNQNFFLDGEETPSLVFQGIEDAVGFSWGFPGQALDSYYTGWHPFRVSGFSAYRLFVRDPISFEKSARMTVGFGPTEEFYIREYSKPDRPLEMSSVAYWYQTEPHQPWMAMPPYQERLPGLSATQRREDEKRAHAYRQRGAVLSIACGHPTLELEFAEPGFGYELTQGKGYAGWPGETAHCWTDDASIQFVIRGPSKMTGLLRLYCVDPDRFQGGRKERIVVAGKEVKRLEAFERGRWVEVPVNFDGGNLSITIHNARSGSNAVVSKIEFFAPRKPRLKGKS